MAFVSDLNTMNMALLQGTYVPEVVLVYNTSNNFKKAKHVVRVQLIKSDKKRKDVEMCMLTCNDLNQALQALEAEPPPKPFTAFTYFLLFLVLVCSVLLLLLVVAVVPL